MINNLSQLSQIVVNVLFFQTACSDLETLLVTLRSALCPLPPPALSD